MDTWMQTAQGYILSYGLSVLGALVILIVGRFAAGVTRSVSVRALERAKADPSVVSFTGNLVHAAVLILTVVAALANFGVQTGSIIAILGAASFAIALALQGSLSNFASGILILAFRPFGVGSFIEAAGVLGTVKDIQLFATVITTPDNVQVTVPNGKLYGDVIRNFTAYDTRRIDLPIGIGYAAPADKALELLLDLVKSDERVLADPAPMAGVTAFGESSVDLVARFWVNRSDFLQVQFDLRRRLKEVFDANGIEIPFPQRVIHTPKPE